MTHCARPWAACTGQQLDARPQQPPPSAPPLEGQVSAEVVINPCGQGSGHGHMAIHMSIELGSQCLHKHTHLQLITACRRKMQPFEWRHLTVWLLLHCCIHPKTPCLCDRWIGHTSSKSSIGYSIAIATDVRSTTPSWAAVATVARLGVV